MTFASPFFLSIVLPVLVAAYFALPAGRRNAFLLAASLLAYAWVAPVGIAILLVLTVSNHLLAVLAARRRDSDRVRRTAIFAAVALDAATLAACKYGGFLADRLGPGFPRFALAAGMSFYVFQLISYVADAGSGKTSVGSMKDVLLYVCFVPKVPCGPIARFYDFTASCKDHSLNPADIAYGTRRFFVGLAKKALLADMLARAVDPIFGTPVEMLPCAYCWLGAIAYSLQIYFDFSGCSDMAIGLARIFGYKLPENFDFPYSSRSIQEFWRRWHMSLSFWLRDYVYIPLGGSRHGAVRACLNTMAVFLLCGIWHGSTWTFVLWGALHGAAVVAERLGLKRLLAAVPEAFARAYVLLFVAFGWVVFRSPSVEYALGFMCNMVLGNPSHPASGFVQATNFVTFGETWIMLAAMLAAFAAPCRILSAIDRRTRGILFAAVALLAYVFAMTGNVTPGIYEKF